jgi:tetratricopeptide (TPR) repeat protein
MERDLTLLRELTARAEELARAGVWGSEMIDVSTRILKLDRGSVDSYTRLARCCREKGDLERAAKLYRGALHFAPENRIAKNGLAAIKELRRLQSAAETAATHEEAFHRGMAARRSGNNVKAVAFLEQALAYRRDAVCGVALAAAYRDVGRIADAEELYRAILTHYPKYVPALNGLGGVCRDRNALPEAEGLYRETLRLKPGNPAALRGLSGVYSDLGRHGEAGELYGATITDHDPRRRG